MASRQPLVAIVGPTASGKSQLALEVAQKFDGEIICADSRTVYKGMDIGTAKPSQEDRNLVRHHILDVVAPGQAFTTYDFKKLATRAIVDIRQRGRLPLLVGGTGLYIDSVLFDYDFPKPRDTRLRNKLNKLSLEKLYDYCKNNSIALPVNEKNKRHVIATIMRSNQNLRKRMTPIDNVIIVGISTSKAVLEQRITQRAEHLFSQGVVEEAKKLGEIYGWNSEAMSANIYPLIKRYLADELSLEAMKESFIMLDKQLAKRQITWLKRNKFINWRNIGEAETFLLDLFAQMRQK